MLTRQDGLLGWATARLIEHDAQAPGVLRRLLSSGPMRRQAVFLVLANEVVHERHLQVVGGEPDGDEAADRAEVLRDGRANDVVALAIDRVPEGLMGALERIGLKPFTDPRLYARLTEVYLRADQRHVAEALRHAGKITSTMLRLIDILPPELLCPTTLTRLESPSEAAEFVEAVVLAKSVNSRATDAVIREMLGRLPEGRHLTTVVSRLIRRADVELGRPLRADDQVAPIRSVREMILTGRRLKNCLGTDPKIISAVQGRRAYALYRDDTVLEFAPLTNSGWLFLDSHGHGNTPVGEDVEEQARAKVLASGVACLPATEPRGGRFSFFTVPGDSTFIRVAA